MQKKRIQLKKIDESMAHKYHSLSLSQKRYWYDIKNGHLRSNSAVYQIDGDLAVDSLQSVFKRLIQQYPILTSMVVDDRERLARIENTQLQDTLEILDYSDSESTAKIHMAIQECCHFEFDLQTGPLFRFVLIRECHDRYYLVLVTHPIICDKYSLHYLIQQITQYSNTNANPQSYKQLFAAEEDFKNSDNYHKGILHWMHLLGDKQFQCKLPPHRNGQRHNANNHTIFILDKNLQQALATTAQQQQCRIEDLLLVAYTLLLNRLSSESDILINYSVNSQPNDSEYIVGCSDNRLAYRFLVDSKQNLSQLLQQTQAQIIRNDYFKQCASSQIVRAIRENLNDRFDGIFSNAGFEQCMACDLSIDNTTTKLLHEYSNGPNKNDITLLYNVNESQIKLRFVITHADDHLSPQFQQYYTQILTALVTDIKSPMAALNLYDNKSQQAYLQLNQQHYRRDYPRTATVDETFDAIATQQPNKIAIIDQQESISYQQLQQRANRIAYELQQHNDSGNGIVAMYLQRSIESTVAMLGILKAGLAYTPISSEYPEERIEYILSDTNANVIISNKALIANSASLSQRHVILVDQLTHIADNTITITKSHNAQSPAYVIYTSGSTGNPKGVIIPHRAINRLVLNNYYCELTNQSIVAHASSTAFDAATFEVYGALLNGGCLVVFDKETVLSSTLFHQRLLEHHINVLWMTVALFNQFAHEMPLMFAHLDYLLVGGDALNPEMIHRVLRCEQGSPAHIVNGYGPTETTTFAVTYDIPAQQGENQAVPIGYPIANTSCYVLSPEQQLTPHGFIGELYIGGDSVAQGYLNRADLSRQCFINNPFVNEGDYDRVLYRTGDLVRRKANGLIEFVGRCDNQVKIRGFRIELGEIENQLLSHPDIDDAVVIATKPQDGNERNLLAFFTGTKSELKTDIIMDYLKHSLPGYMIPESLKQVNQFPLTSNGKVDKKKLLQGDNQSSAEPSGHDKTVIPIICLLFAKVLNSQAECIQHNSDFFELGGHSLKATQLVAHIRQELNTDISVRDVFELRTPQALAAQIETNRRNLKPQFRLQKLLPGQVAPVSYQMSRGWYLFQMHKNSTYYNLPFEITFDKAPDALLLREALSKLLSQHDIFNLQYGEHEGQLILAYRPQPIHIDIKLITSAEGLDSYRQQYTKTVFALDKQQSHCASIVSCRHNKQCHLFFNIHHNFFDGWSISLFMRELSRIYHQLDNNLTVTKTEQPFNYRDYAYSQSQWQANGAFDSQLEHWKQTLSGSLPLLKMPTDFERPLQPSTTGGQVAINLSVEQSNKLRHIAKQYGVSVFTLLLTTYAAFLHKYTEQEEIMIGTPIANRNLPDLENIIGCFVNTIAYRVQVTPNISIAQLLQQIHQYGLVAMENQEVPFDSVAQHLDAEHHAGISYVFQTIFSFQSGIELSSQWQPEQGDYHVKQWPCGGAKCDLALILYDMADGSIAGEFEYASDLYRHSTIQTYVNQYTNLLARLSQHFDVEIANLSLLTRQERLQLAQSLRVKQRETQTTSCIQQQFAIHVAAQPDMLALADNKRQLSYSQLDHAANQLASLLQQTLFASGYIANQMVGLCVGRSVDIGIGLFGILKSGAAFFPVDPAHPASRIKAIIEQSQVKVIICDDENAAHIRQIDPQVTVITLSNIRKDSCCDYQNYSQPNHLAYTIFTSGSTGKPKGVLVEHKGIPLFSKALAELLHIQPGTVCSQLGSLNFDGGLSEFFITLLNGASCIIADDATRKNPDTLLAFFDKHLIEAVPFIPPALLEVLSTSQPPKTVKTLVIAGDTCAAACIRFWSEHYRLINGYGPSETSIGATYHLFQTNDHPKNIGKPLKHIDAYVLDKQMNPQPPGLVGELYIGGDNILARGYLNRVDLTVKTFVTNPFSDDPNSFIYKTGDLVKQLPCGELIFVGRVGALIKLRGYRIELGEIEAALNRHTAIKQAVVTVMKINDIEQLVSHYTTHTAITADELRSSCSSILPDYMVPNFFVEMPSLAVNINGKIDRKHLPLPTINASTEDHNNYSDIANVIIKLWQQFLGPVNIKLHDNFFQLGGNSFTSIRFLQQLNKRFSVDISATAFLALPTVAACEKLVRGDYQPNDSSIIDTAMQDAQLDLTHYQFQSTTHKKNILLTGANGFVGIHLLQCLLQTYPQANIYCIIRGNEKQALTKLLTAADQYKIDLNDRSRIHILPGDISQQQLGLTDDSWKLLTNTIDCIVHNGAQVHHLYDYHTLKPANVDSTLTLIQLANSGQAKQLHFISTLSAATAHDDNGMLLEVINNKKPPFTSGYLLSKWVAEQLINQAFQHGLQGNIYRLGNITGDSLHGFSNYHNNHALLLLKSCCQLHAAPDWTMDLDLMPVDVCAQLICQWLQQPQQTVMHLSNPNHISWQDYITVVQQAKLPVELVPLNTWQTKLKTIDESNALFPFKDMYLEMQSDGSDTPVVQTAAIQQQLTADQQAKLKAKQLAHTYIRYLQSQHFLQ
ncbi:MAG: amino acid adenylation domain-containing protein [Coxiellaceae bacterium]|nr:amino acid adenylation domain-containing protein [Coxiellaceae bacterium]